MNSMCWSFVIRAYSVLVSFLVSIFISRILPSEDVGVYLSGLTLMAGITIIVRFGFDNYLVKINSAKQSDKLSNFLILTFYTVIVFITVSLIAIVPLYFFDWRFLNENKVIPYFWIASFFFAILGIISGFFKSVGRSPLANFIEAGLIPTALMLCYLFLFKVMTLDLAIKLYLVIIIFGVIIFYLYIFLKYRITGIVKKINFESMVESSGIMISSLLDFCVLWFSALILINYANLSDVADFQVAQRLSVLISFVLIVMNSITSPIYARSFSQGDILKVERVFCVSNSLMTIIAALPLLIFWCAPKFILGFFGEDYRDAGVILMILSFGQLINVMSGSVGYILMMSGHGRLYRNSSICGAVLAVILAISLVPSFGAVGAAISSSLGIAVKNLMGVFFVKRLYGFSGFPTINRLLNILMLKEKYEIFTYRD